MSSSGKQIDMAPEELNKMIFTFIAQVLGLKAYDIMHDALYLDDDTSIAEAAKKLADKDISEVIVINDNMKVIGIVTDKDIVRRVVSKNLNPEDVKLRDVMTKDVIVVLGETDLGTIAKIMHDNGIRRVPVVNRAGKILGVVDARDLAGALTAQRDVLRRLVEGLEEQLKKIAVEVQKAKEEMEKKEKEKEEEAKFYG
jgi:IMP dehydrogenase